MRALYSVLFLDNKFFITFIQIYKTNSKLKHKKHKTIYQLYTRLYLVIYFSLPYKFARYPSKRCSVKKTFQKSCKTHRNKHARQSLPFNKATGQRPATLLKNSPRHRSSSREHSLPQSISGGCFRTDKKGNYFR